MAIRVPCGGCGLDRAPTTTNRIGATSKGYDPSTLRCVDGKMLCQPCQDQGPPAPPAPTPEPAPPKPEPQAVIRRKAKPKKAVSKKIESVNVPDLGGHGWTSSKGKW